VLSALAAHTAWHWMVERGEAWWKHPLPRPELSDVAELLAWATAALVTGVVLWALRDRVAVLMTAADDQRHASR
jgi:hypothetical protein